jgi:PIN domain nuclease of toxin-antitoxin system
MGAVMSDTHAAVWYIVEPQSLMVEINYLVEKVRLSSAVLQRLIGALRDANSALTVSPLDFNIALAVKHVSRSSVPHMPDRIIAAAALHLNLPLVTRDLRIQAAGVQTIW